MSIVDIINALTILNRATIKEVLDHIGIQLEYGEEAATGKLDMLYLVGSAVVDMGIECFVDKCDGAVLYQLALLFGVVPSRQSVADQIRFRSISVFLQQTDIGILIPFY